MKNIAINNLAYTGIVTLSQYFGQEKVELAKVKNAGGTSLFNFLAGCLTGDFEAVSSDRPTKIMLLKKTDSDDPTELYAKASGFIYLRAKPEQERTENSSSVCYSFIIPKEYLTNYNFTNIGLYANSATDADLANYAAICEPNIETISLSPDTILAIDWKLTISNQN